MVRFRVSQSQGQRDTVRQTASCATRISGAYYTIQQRCNLGRATRNASSVHLNRFDNLLQFGPWYVEIRWSYACCLSDNVQFLLLLSPSEPLNSVLGGET